MKKLVLFLLFTIVSSVSAFADGAKFKIKSCERYGADVLIIFEFDNTEGSEDEMEEFDKPDSFVILDAEGNAYRPTRFTNGTLKTHKYHDWTRLVGLSREGAPIGSYEVFSSVTVPAEGKLQLRLVVTDVPQSVKQFSCIQFTGHYQIGEGNKNGYSFTLYNKGEDAKYLTITDVK